jgi:hypothetical protein
MPAHHSGGAVMRFEVPDRGSPVSSSVFRLDSTSGHPLEIPCSIGESGSSSEWVTVSRAAPP